MITTIAKLQSREGKEAEMRAALEKMVASVSADEPGVPKYELHTSNDDPTVFYFYEQYDSEDGPRLHRPHEAARRRPQGRRRSPPRDHQPYLDRRRHSLTNHEPGRGRVPPSALALGNRAPSIGVLVP